MACSDLWRERITKILKSKDSVFILFELGGVGKVTLKIKKENLPNLLVKMIKYDAENSEIASYNKQVIEALIKQI